MKKFNFLLLLIAFAGCTANNNTEQSQTEQHEPSPVPASVIEHQIDLPTEALITTEHKQVKKNETRPETKSVKKADTTELLSMGRYVEFPGDAAYNGKPMVQQMDFPAKLYEKYPDTLAKMAVESYRHYDSFFPKSIACDFENGTSHESIHYPEKLIFRYELFENDKAYKPYATKDIVIRRNEQGEPYAE